MSLPAADRPNTLWDEIGARYARVNPEVEQARNDLWERFCNRETQIGELLTTGHKTDSGRPLLSCAEWQAILGMTTRAVIDLADSTLALCADSPDTDFFDEGRRLSGLTHGMCIDLWRRVIANAELERDHSGVDAQEYAEAAAMEATRTVMFIAGQKILNRRQPSSHLQGMDPQDRKRAPKKRGRPRRFTDQQIIEARAAKSAGKSNNAAAKILYKTNTPTPRQRNCVPKILKYPRKNPIEK